MKDSKHEWKTKTPYLFWIVFALILLMVLNVFATILVVFVILVISQTFKRLGVGVGIKTFIWRHLQNVGAVVLFVALINPSTRKFPEFNVTTENIFSLFESYMNSSLTHIAMSALTIGLITDGKDYIVKSFKKLRFAKRERAVTDEKGKSAWK